MIRRLRRQFILIATGAVLVIMTALIGVISAAMEHTVNMFVDNVTENLQGMPSTHDDFFSKSLLGALDSQDVFYYQISTNSSYEVISYDDAHHPGSLTSTSAQKLVDCAESSRTKNRFLYGGNYYAWFSQSTDSGYVFTIIDYSIAMRWVIQIRHTAVLIGVLGFIVFEILVVALSGKAIEPALKNAENQKRFITNASHELKTPVAVISADNEVIEAMHGKDEWTESISNQVKKLNSLITSLVQLSKSSEMGKVELSVCNVSSIVQEQADSFHTLIEGKGLQFVTEIPEDVHAKTNAQCLSQVLGILLDNASKYCDEKGIVQLDVEKTTSRVLISVSNNYRDGENIDYSKFFERFYRQDTSHNSAKKGFGIGLSIAQELIGSMNAKINADWKDGRMIFTIVL